MTTSIQPSITKAEQIDGWMRVPELTWLSEKANNSYVIIEVGSYKGRSTRALCDSTPGIVYSVDPYYDVYYSNVDKRIFSVGDPILQEFNRNMLDHIVSGKLIHFSTTLDNIPKSIIADFIFIDGDHRYEAVKSDIKAALERIKPGGLLSGHDYGDPAWPGVQQAVDEMFPKTNKVDSIWWLNV